MVQTDPPEHLATDRPARKSFQRPPCAVNSARPRTPRPGWRPASPALALLFALWSVIAAPANAQPQGTVFVDDSTLAAETLETLPELLAGQNTTEAARALQRVLDTEADRLLPSDDDPDIYITVRARVHAELRRSPELLEVYRDQHSAQAARVLASEGPEAAERRFLLTDPGFEAALRVAQTRMERGLFSAAWRTLEQLDDHPARSDATRSDTTQSDAARLATALARYLPALRTADMLARWQGSAGLPIEHPPRLTAPDYPIRTAIDPVGPVSLEGVVPTSLSTATVPAARDEADTNETATAQPRATARRGPAGIETFTWFAPILDQGAVYIADGGTVSAIDRFTLRDRWSYEGNPARRIPGPSRLTGLAAQVEDRTTLTLTPDAVIAAMGIALPDGGEGSAMLVALDRDSGAAIWESDLNDASDLLENASIRGPIVVAGDTAIVTLRRSARGRRLISLHAAGVSLADGTVRWVTPLGSIGALPYQQQTRRPEAPVIVNDIAVRADEIGVIAAVDAADGRPIWTRVTASQIARRSFNSGWNVHQPIAHDGSLVILEPTGESIIRIDPDDGSLISTRNADDLGSPEYLLRVADSLAAVGDDRVAFVPLAGLETKRPRFSPRLQSSSFVGRAVAAGDDLLVATTTGVLVIPSDDPKSQQLTPLDEPGSIVAADGQVLAVRGGDIHSYVAWDRAAELLRDRIEASPNDPEPATTLADLAYRAERYEDILPAAEDAERALGAMPPGEQREQRAAALFDAMLNMALEQLDPNFASAPEPVTLAGGLIDRLAGLARSPEQRVSERFARGSLSEARGSHDLAAAAYHDILTSTELSTAPWRPRLGRSVRADLEAVKRLESILAAQGHDLYEPFEREAEARIAAASGTDSADPSELEAIARGYPFAAVSVSAWLEAGRAHAAQQRDLTAMRATERGLLAAERRAGIGAESDSGVISRLAGMHIELLADAGRIDEALFAIDDLASRFPGLEPAADTGEPLALDTLRAALRSARVARRPLPRIGAPAPEANPQLVPGIALLPILRIEDDDARPEAGSFSTALVWMNDGRLALLAPPDGADPGASQLQQVWSRPNEGAPTLLRRDGSSAWIMWRDGGEIWFERVNTADGSPFWRSDNWSEVVTRQDADQPRRGFSVSVVTDRRTLVVTERSGAAAGFDAASGSLLWSRELPIRSIADIDLRGPTLAVIGARGEGPGTAGTLVVADPRTGAIFRETTGGLGDLQWTRIAASGSVLVGSAGGTIESIDPLEGRAAWSARVDRADRARDAWLIGPRLYVRDDDQNLRVLSATTGALDPSTIETAGRVSSRRDARLIRTQSGIAVASEFGLVVVSDRGERVGEDALDAQGNLLLPATAEGTLATIERRATRAAFGGSPYELHRFDTESAALLDSTALDLPARPEEIAAIDGYLLVNAGEAMVVIRCPTGR